MFEGDRPRGERQARRRTSGTGRRPAADGSRLAGLGYGQMAAWARGLRRLPYGSRCLPLCFACVRFSHIIATKERPALLQSALMTLVAVIPPDGEIIVVDGDPARSGQPVVAEIESLRGGRPIRYIDGVSGTCSQRNAGIDAAQGDVVIFTDDDCTPAEGFYETLASAYEDPEVIGVTGRVLQRADERIGSNIESPLRRMVLGGGRQGSMTSFGFRRPIRDLDTPRSVEYMPGTFMSARTSAAAEVRFDEGLQRLSGYALGEDDDFLRSFRAEGSFATSLRRPTTGHSARPRWTGGSSTGSS